MDAVSRLSSSPPPPPVHVAIIMDGNGRWARARGLPRIAGHRRGVEAVRSVIEAAADLGVEHLTLFGFSSENWNRPAEEVSDLMSLLRFYLRSEIEQLHKNGIRLRVIGDRASLAPDIVRLIADAERLTANNTRLFLHIALSYGGRGEIVEAARRLARDVLAERITLEELDETAFSAKLYTAGIPDPDLVIRTSGEKRLSNFLLWQLAYSEFVFVDCHWPEFSRANLEEAISEFQKRERRYGATAG